MDPGTGMVTRRNTVSCESLRSNRLNTLEHKAKEIKRCQLQELPGLKACTPLKWSVDHHSSRKLLRFSLEYLLKVPAGPLQLQHISKARYAVEMKSSIPCETCSFRLTL